MNPIVIRSICLVYRYDVDSILPFLLPQGSLDHERSFFAGKGVVSARGSLGRANSENKAASGFGQDVLGDLPVASVEYPKASHVEAVISGHGHQPILECNLPQGPGGSPAGLVYTEPTQSWVLSIRYLHGFDVLCRVMYRKIHSL